MRLYHYTCQHGRDGIGEQGFLVPPSSLDIDWKSVRRWPDWQRPMVDLIWLTDLDVPDCEALGLTSNSLHCDRTEYCYEVAEPFVAGIERWTFARRRFPRQLRHGLETAPGALPRHWFIATALVPVSLMSPVPVGGVNTQ